MQAEGPSRVLFPDTLRFGRPTGGSVRHVVLKLVSVEELPFASRSPFLGRARDSQQALRFIRWRLEVPGGITPSCLPPAFSQEGRPVGLAARYDFGMTPAREWGVLVVTCLGLAAFAGGCSSAHSLAQDQHAVNSLHAHVNQDQTRVSTDQTNVAADTPPMTEQQTVLCEAYVAAIGPPCPSQATSPRLRHDTAQVRQDEAKLKADEFNLQAAEDQLKKDESGN